MDVYISRHECADRFGVSAQTISNYVGRGLLSHRVINGKIYISKYDADKFQKDYITDISSDEDAIRTYSEEVKNIRKRLEQERKDLINSYGTHQQFMKKVDSTMMLILSYNRFAGSILTKKEVYILSGIIYGKKVVADLASETGISDVRIRQIVDNSLRKLENSKCIIESLEEKVSELQSRCMRQHESIKILEEKLCRYNECYGEEPDINHEVMISACSFSVRTYNCLSSIGVETLGDVVRLGRRKVMSIRNMGKKSIAEIDARLGEYNMKLE